jgi:hypothetical protein
LFDSSLLVPGIKPIPSGITKTTGRLATLSRIDAFAVVILCAFVVGTWLPRFRGPIDLRWDGAVYYILGTSLAEGKGYRLLNEPGEILEVQYPPLLPLIVAAHQRVLGTSDPIIVGQSLRLSFFLVFIFYIVGIYLVLRNHLPLKYAFVGTLLCLFNLHTYLMSDLLFPEIPFAFVTILFILCSRNHSRRIYPILAGLLAIAAYALRTIGTTVLAAWIAESLFKRQFKRAALRLVLSALPVLCWQGYISLVESGPRYHRPFYDYQRANYLCYNVSYANNIFSLKDPFTPEAGRAALQDIAARFTHNLTWIPTSLGAAVSSTTRLWELPWNSFNMPFPVATPWPAHVMLITLGFLILGGLGLLVIRRQFMIPFYISSYFIMMCLTPWPEQFYRYLVPVAPFLVLSLFTMLLAIRDQCQKLLPAPWKAAGLAVTISLVAVILIQQSLTLFVTFTKWHPEVVYNRQQDSGAQHRLFFYHDAYRVLDKGLEWLKLRAKATDVVAGSMPHWVYLRTGLKAVMPPYEPDPAKAQHLLNSVPVKYLILDEELAIDTRRYTSPVVRSFPGGWKRVYSASVISEFGTELKNRFEIYERVDSQITSAAANR